MNTVIIIITLITLITLIISFAFNYFDYLYNPELEIQNWCPLGYEFNSEKRSCMWGKLHFATFLAAIEGLSRPQELSSIIIASLLHLGVPGSMTLSG